MKSKWLFPAWENTEVPHSGGRTRALLPGAAPRMEPQGWADPPASLPASPDSRALGTPLLFAATR